MSNLEIVTRVKNCNYELFMRPDTNTNTHFQWFYFRVHITKKKRVKFTIKNFIKSTMLYSKVIFFQHNLGAQAILLIQKGRKTTIHTNK